MGASSILINLKLFVRKSLDKVLARFGFILLRVRSGIPPSFIEYLRLLLFRGIRPDAGFCFDSDSQLQGDLLSILPSTKVCFASNWFTGNESVNFLQTIAPRDLKARFLVEIDVRVF